MSKYTEKRIEEIVTLTTNVIPNAMNNGISPDEYLASYRIALNLTIIQAIFGAEFKKPKKDGKNSKVKFNHKLANASELSTITKLLNDFVINYEKAFLNNSTYECFADDDIDIPNRSMECNSLPTLKKVNGKNIHKFIFGSDNKIGTSKVLLTGMDVYDLAATAEKIKKVKNRNTILLIGGITLIVTGGAIATICINNNKKKNAAGVDGIDVDVEDISIDEIDSMDIDMDDDIPQIDI